MKFLADMGIALSFFYTFISPNFSNLFYYHLFPANTDPAHSPFTGIGEPQTLLLHLVS